MASTLNLSLPIRGPLSARRLSLIGSARGQPASIRSCMGKGDEIANRSLMMSLRKRTENLEWQEAMARRTEDRTSLQRSYGDEIEEKHLMMTLRKHIENMEWQGVMAKQTEVNGPLQRHDEIKNKLSMMSLRKRMEVLEWQEVMARETADKAAFQKYDRLGESESNWLP